MVPIKIPLFTVFSQYKIPFKTSSNYQIFLYFYLYDGSQKAMELITNPLAVGFCIVLVSSMITNNIVITNDTAALTAVSGFCTVGAVDLCLPVSYRMKYLWTSHMCVFASFGLCSPEIWELLLKLIHLYNPKRVSAISFSISFLWLSVFLSLSILFSQELSKYQFDKMDTKL